MKTARSLLALVGVLQIQITCALSPSPFLIQSFDHPEDTAPSRVYITQLSLPQNTQPPGSANAPPISLGDWLHDPSQIGSDFSTWSEDIENQFGVGVEVRF